MKKLILSLFVILLISGMINAKISYLELRTNYFNPSNSDFKDIYGGGIQYGLELGFDIRESFTVWIGGSFFNAEYGDRRKFGRKYKIWKFVGWVGGSWEGSW
jgi:hypothetical protein